MNDTIKNKPESSLNNNFGLYKEIFTNSGDAIGVIDSEGKYLIQNPAHKNLYGFTDSELIGKTPAIHMGEEQFRKILNSLKQKGRFKGEVICHNKNGDKLIINTSFFRIRDEESDAGYYVCFGRNVTDVIKADDALIKSEHKYRELVEKSLQGIIILQDFRIVYANEAFAKMTGYSVEKLLSFTPEDIEMVLHPDDRKLVLGNLSKRLLGLDAPQHYQFRVLGNDNKLRVMEIYAQRIEYEGKPAAQGFILDITDKVEARKALEESERNYRMILENTSDLIVKVDPEGRLMFVSPSYCKLFGKSEGELLGKPFMPLVHEEDRQRTADAMEDLKKPPHTCYVEQRAMTVKGWRWLAWSDKAIVDDEGNIIAIIGSGRDIHEMKQTEQTLKQRTEFIETILKNLPMGLSVNEIRSGKFTFINDELKKIYGWDNEDLPDIQSVYKKVYTNDFQKRQIMNEIKNNLENKIDVNMYWNDIEIKTKDGQTKIISTKIIPLYEQNLMISTVLDLTERIKADNQLKRSLEEKEILLKEIHHRVKNNLQTIISLLDLQIDAVEDNRTKEILKSSLNRVTAMALIHEKLYKSKDLSKIKANEYLQNLIDYLYSVYKTDSNRITMSSDVTEFLLTLDTAIPCGMIINELVSNSIKHAFTEKSDDRRITIYLKEKDENNLILSVKDNGIGIPLDMNLNDSSTLGLKLVNLFVKQLEGKITFSGVNGTSVEIVFPKPVYLLNEN